MRKKTQERNKCIELRKKGLSIKQIAKEVNVTKSSVSVWVKDILLDEKQKAKLHQRRKYCNEKINGYALRSGNYRKKRENYQKEGRKKAKQLDAEYAFGCALFWGEGHKEKNVLKITNSDASLLKFFVNFLQKYFDVKKEEISINIQYYLNGDLSLLDIENYWCEVLDLPQKCLRNHIFKGKYYNNTNVKYPYGICSVSVFSTQKVMEIYGSIKEYIGDTSDRWLW